MPINLSPLTTGPASAASSTGRFCTGQLGPPHAGCFGSSTCRTINENGSPAGMVFTNVPANATLASVFCIVPSTGSSIHGPTCPAPAPFPREQVEVRRQGRRLSDRGHDAYRSVGDLDRIGDQRSGGRPDHRELG